MGYQKNKKIYVSQGQNLQANDKRKRSTEKNKKHKKIKKYRNKITELSKKSKQAQKKEKLESVMDWNKRNCLF